MAQYEVMRRASGPHTTKRYHHSTTNDERGNRLKAWRERHNVSHRELAEYLGVDTGTVSDWEQGKRTPRHRMIDLALQCWDYQRWTAELWRLVPEELRAGLSLQ